MKNMEKTILLLALLVVGAHCQCCFPKQFEGILGMSAGEQQNGTGIAYQFIYNISVDIKNNMAALSGDVFYNGKVIKEQVLQDFNKRKQYLVMNGKCQVSEMTEPGFMPCIPEDAKKVMSSYYGYKERISFDMYTFMYGKGVSITVSVETGSCAPVAEHIQTKDGIYDSGYMGLTPGFKDEHVFDVPAACKKTVNEPMFSHRLHSIRKKRPSLFGGI